MGKLNFYYGAMNSGKTIDLIRTAYNYNENGFNVLVIKPSIDTKSGNNIETRVGLKRLVDYKISKKDSFFDILRRNLGGISCIFIDEAQFLTRKQVDELSLISAAIDDIAIICYGLRVDFMNNGFDGSTRLLEIADQIEEIKTLCSCGNIARHNARIINGEFVSKGESILIDGEDDNITYAPLCTRCYEELVNKQNLKVIKEMLGG